MAKSLIDGLSRKDFFFIRLSFFFLSLLQTTDPKSMNLFNPVPSTAHNIFAPAPMGDHNQYLNSRQIIAMDDEFQSDPETVRILL